MCGIHTENVVLPAPPPAPAKSATFAPRLLTDGPVGAGQVGKVRSVTDLRIRDPFLTSSE